jgi:8-oxo-dGTP pyrophosphatase MutT (NUDIX family)
MAIPVCGCIMLNSSMSKLVLVRNWKGTSWSFPRGKINQDENPFDCAMRETYEETGFNPREYCMEERVIAIQEQHGKAATMFIAVGVPESTAFTPQTRKEISKVEFHDLNNLPKNNWGVLPFMQLLIKWIEKNYVGKKKGPKDKKKKGERAADASAYDKRNQSTFGDIGNGKDTWGVEDMFSANSKLTGKDYIYDGNPHNFGSVHPRYVNYNEAAAESLEVGTAAATTNDTLAAPVTCTEEPSTICGETEMAAQRDVAKIRAILKYLELPGLDLNAEKSVRFDQYLKSITEQRKMVRKVKEAGGTNITENRMEKILSDSRNGQGSLKKKQPPATTLHTDNSVISPVNIPGLTLLLDTITLMKGVDSYLDAYYDAIEW